MSEPTDRLAEADERPWEEPGSCRMDCAPHRGPLLMLLGTVSLVCGCLSVFLIPAIVGLPLGLVVAAVAAADLRKMEAGLMDTDGELTTEKAFAAATYGFFLSAVFGLFCSPLGLPLLLEIARLL